MGYSVGFDFSQDRWIGYGVPAVCDIPDCGTTIDHGMAYKCESGHGDEPDGIYDVERDAGGTVISIKEAPGYDPDAFEDEGCELFFCEEHRYDTKKHEDIQPKPDIPQWEHHMLLDSSWAKWREDNASKIPGMQERTKGYVCNEECEHE